MRLQSNLKECSTQVRKFINSGPTDSAVSFERLALELFALQFEGNLVYQTFCQTRGASPSTVNHWTEIPAVPASAFKEWEFTSLSRAERTRVFHSSGTSGQQPSRHFHSSESLDLYDVSLLTSFSRSVIPLRRLATEHWRVTILTPPPPQACNSSLVHMFATIAAACPDIDSAFLGRTSPDGSWTLDLPATVAFLQEGISFNRPILLLGAAFSFVHLCDHLWAEARCLKFPAGSLALETGGYKNRSRALERSELHKLITERLGIDPGHIIREYGMSELSSQAYDRLPDKGFPTAHSTRHFLFPPWAKVRILSAESGQELGDGETGLIQIFDLANVYSVMAIQTEDLGARHGDGFEVIGRAATAESRGCSLLMAG